ncbi:MULTISPECIES: amino acid ABC transporter permease [Burkholderia]|uniref:Amino acid ABC transporter permease n=1 Tax=Burkholderia gladioli TaxID=28095 RepID=A0A2A7SGJ6_BURGA|nr:MULTISPECIES: amino acid ABC transporter permease [Burkholderia]ATF87876.1 amino acid ABC transporter permease [Burkholderia gladioli pv. gladioli]MBJ9713982.1 amino acid ABC transporter permease [Burkholderia gladioli]MBU9156367.1 amino acid ABC transporter permease [Burkholderia gladioli]MBU9165856.1 amino acid ABC transporter permease [Burkholderia gladioli]MBU9425449.1 amino acid ABC transporter permease [Burkholderia gladioli]
MIDSFLAPKYLLWLWQGFGVTLGLALAAGLSSTCLGAALALAGRSRWRAVRGLARLYIGAFRNTPLLVQLFFWYFGAATLLPDEAIAWLNAQHILPTPAGALRWPSFEFLAGWLGLSCYTAAFVAGEFASGIAGVREGQWQAAAALGLTPWQAFRHIVLPQAVRIALPPLFGQYMNLVKNSSLTMAIGLAELSYASRQVETESFRTFEAFGVATLLYILAIAALEAALHTIRHLRDTRLGARR